MTTSFELIAMTDEIIGMLRRILKGVNADAGHLAVDVIQEVGPGGEYLTHRHTLAHFREMWDSELIDRASYEEWSNKGSKSMGQRIHEKVKHVLENHKPEPLDIDKSKAIAEVLEIRESNL
jgi:trimethylamine--corrinoid protein Co-methyltransferase